jgi:3-oxoacyl-[acyl-carrier protein] reductase
MKRLQGKRALVTGSSRGIGQQIAQGLAREGCNLILHGRKKENLQKTIDLVSDYGVEIDVVEGELSSTEQVQSIASSVLERYEGIDILYNNAAVMSQWNEIWEIPLQEWDRTFQINFYSMMALCQAFAPGMRDRGYGRIVNLTSGIKDIPQLAPYSVSKAALDKYTKDLAAELRGSGVLVNSLDPGWLKTDLGGENAEHEVTTVLPGALVPVLFDDDGPTGEFICAQDYREDK